MPTADVPRPPSDVLEPELLWDQIVRENAAQVYRVALRLTGNRPDAEDLTHDVFLRIFRSLPTYRPGSFDGWAYRVTTNLFLDRMRRKRRIRFDPFAPGAEERLAARESDPAAAFDAGVLSSDVQSALDSLPPGMRAAVVLRDIDGFGYDEIARVLGVRPGTVRSRTHRARTRLRLGLDHGERAGGGAGPRAPTATG